MHQALRFSLILVTVMAVASVSGCATHDRRIYSTRKDKNLHVPDPFAPSTTQAAEAATSSLGPPPDASDSMGPSDAAPSSPPDQSAPDQSAPPVGQ
ncbi:MAG: hypothetical protein ABSE62_12305 [Chthoniobacteraceae bacterium]|jgi:hypothetical protein